MHHECSFQAWGTWDLGGNLGPGGEQDPTGVSRAMQNVEAGTRYPVAFQGLPVTHSVTHFAGPGVKV